MFSLFFHLLIAAIISLSETHYFLYNNTRILLPFLISCCTTFTCCTYVLLVFYSFFFHSYFSISLPITLIHY